MVALPPRRRTVALRWVVGGAAAAGIAIALLTVRASDLQEQLTAERNKADMEEVYERAARRAAAQPVAVTREERTVAELLLLPDGTGLLRNEGLEPLEAGRTYQLWAVVDDGQGGSTVVSAGVLGREPTVSGFTMAGPVVSFVITVEEGYGVVSSDQPAFAFADIPPYQD